MPRRSQGRISPVVWLVLAAEFIVTGAAVAVIAIEGWSPVMWAVIGVPTALFALVWVQLVMSGAFGPRGR